MSFILFICSVHCFTGPLGSMGNAAADCEELANCNAPSGLYYIGAVTTTTFYCDMETAGGGWLRLFERLPNSACPSPWINDTSTGFCRSACDDGSSAGINPDLGQVRPCLRYIACVKQHSL
jgi:hypothetical protein